jgi:very-short-patch-repair endonuclease
MNGLEIPYNRCESPIESAFCRAIFEIDGIRAIRGEYVPSRFKRPATPAITVFAQHMIDPYRVDFLLIGTAPQKASISLIVECDGEEFHGLQQLFKDGQRAFALRGLGFRLLRFWGHQIYVDPTLVVKRTIAEFADHGWEVGETAAWLQWRLDLLHQRHLRLTSQRRGRLHEWERKLERERQQPEIRGPETEIEDGFSGNWDDTL